MCIEVSYVYTIVIRYDVDINGCWDDDANPKTRAIYVVAESTKEAMAKAAKYADEELYGGIGKIELLAEQVWVR